MVAMLANRDAYKAVLAHCAPKRTYVAPGDNTKHEEGEWGDALQKINEDLSVASTFIQMSFPAVTGFCPNSLYLHSMLVYCSCFLQSPSNY